MDQILFKTMRALYLFSPAFIANMAPVLAAHFKLLPYFDRPIDGNRLLFGLPLFGSHKTYRGFIVGIVAAIFTVYVQNILNHYPFFERLSFIDYQHFSLVLLGFLAGFGALFGDLLKSFIKRRLGIDSGRPFFPFDQWDLVVGSYVLLIVYVPIPADYLLILLIITPFLHLAANMIAYQLGLKEVWW